MTHALAALAAGVDGSEPTHSLIGYHAAVFGFLAVLMVGVAIVMVVVMRSEDPIEVGPKTLETPPQTPAVAALLTHPQEVPGEAVAATVVDLAARGALEIVDLGGGATGVRLTTRDPGGITPYESMVLDLVRSRVDGSGIAPAAELALADDRQAKVWIRRFRDQVRVEARAAGWVRSRYGRETAWLGGVLLGLGLIAYVWGRATVTHHPYAVPTSSLPHGEARAGLPFAAVALGVADMAFLIRLATLPSQRLTASGRLLASRWHGVAAHLREDEQFDRAPVAAVAIWHRLLAYATAFGVARVVQASLPVGPMSPTRAWSSATGHWRQVSVEYPTVWPLGWGRLPAELFKQGFAVTMGAVFPAFGVSAVLGGLASNGTLTRHAPFPVLLFVAAIVVALAGGLLYGLSLIVTAAYLAVAGDQRVDTVVGTIVRVVPGGEDRPWLWVAVDTGATTRIRAYASRVGCAVRQGGRARVLVRRADGRVVDVEPATDPASAPNSSSGYFTR